MHFLFYRDCIYEYAWASTNHFIWVWRKREKLEEKVAPSFWQKSQRNRVAWVVISLPLTANFPPGLGLNPATAFCPLPPILISSSDLFFPFFCIYSADAVELFLLFCNNLVKLNSALSVAWLVLQNWRLTKSKICVIFAHDKAFVLIWGWCTLDFHFYFFPHISPGAFSLLLFIYFSSITTSWDEVCLKIQVQLFICPLGGTVWPPIIFLIIWH